MCKNCGPIVEINNTKNVVRRLLGEVKKVITLNAYAEEDNSASGEGEENGDEGVENTDTSSKSSKYNFEDLVAKARSEEKSKQMNKVKKLEGQNTKLTEQHNNDLVTIAGLEEQIKELTAKLKASGKDDSEEVRALKESVKTLEADKTKLADKVKTLEAETVDEDELRTQIKEELEKEYKVKTYKAEKLAEHKDDLLVPELVFGDSVEDIDSSLELALARSKEIRESVGIVTTTKTKKTPSKPSNPSVKSAQDNTYSIEYLASLDVRSEEYKQVRKALNLR